MLPIVINPIHIQAGLVGSGPQRDGRANLLAEAGVEVRLLPEAVPDSVLQDLQLLFVAGLPDSQAKELATRARGFGVLVNVEDNPPLCDFHMPSIVRRGDLLITASTGGQVPGLARALHEFLAQQFGPEWTARLKELSLARAKWRSQGLSAREVSQQVRELIVRMGWL